MNITIDKSKMTAIALAAGGAILFSAKAVFIKMAYAYDISSIELMMLRMLFAMPCYLIILWLDSRKKDQKPISKNTYVQIILFGFLGYYLASYLDFIGLQYISASMERLILFVYPTLVLLLSFLFMKQKLLLGQVIAVIMTYTGVALALINRQMDPADNLTLGAIFIFLSAFTYAVYLIGSGNLIPKVGSVRFTALAMIVACISVFIHNAFKSGNFDLLHYPSAIYGYGVALALISTVIPSFMISEAIKRMGPGQVAIVSSVGPISTIIMSIALLGEVIVWNQWLGTIVVILGITMITLQKNKKIPKAV